ncbi:MAG: lipase family protein [Planctomycetota bacterium]|jgi:hypothetical protein
MDFDNTWEALVDPGKATDFFALAPHLRRGFIPGRSAWDLGQAWWLAELSRVIYRGEGRQGFLHAAGLQEQQFFTTGSTQCAIVRPETGDDFAILVFRGTDELRDWLANVRAVPVAWPQGGNVHRGFRRAFRKVWDEVVECMDSMDSVASGPTPWFYTGHSLGGALATLAASARPPVATYTFGAPRVGDPEFQQTLTTPLYRVVNHRDIVTTLPPRIEALGFVHGGQLRYIGSDGRLVLDPTEAEVAANRAAGERRLEDLADQRRWFDPHETLSDHAPVNYVAHLVRLLGEESR